jgi:hypothetical protein
MTARTEAEVEALRLAKLYEALREKLLDLTLGNRMLNYSLSEKSKSRLRIVDEVPDNVYRRLVTSELSQRIKPLPDPSSVPNDEKTEDFQALLAQRKVTDQDYAARTAQLDADNPDDELKFEEAEAELRDKVRRELNLPPRKSAREVNRKEHARSLGIDPSYDLPARGAKDAHEDGALQTLRYPGELEAVLDGIRSNARLAEQEMGLSTLFLAFGFLEWAESENTAQRRYAPLLLLPVKLEAKELRGREAYSVSAREQDAETNLSLQKKLERDFHLALSTFEPGDDDRDPVEAYFRQLEEVLAADGVPGWIAERWKVRRWLVLGQFAFGRLAMYTDLDPVNWKGAPSSHTLVVSVLRGTDGAAKTVEETFAQPGNYDIDDPAIERLAPYLIHDADAFQHSAVIDAMKGENLVIHGPPGTGKSQTIANIIANALGAGKKVLFLAEKQAALDVVKRRLEAARLGEFCLELHSDKLAPKTVIASIRERIGAGFGGARVPPSGDPGWSMNKQAIRNYLDALHNDGPEHETPFASIWTAVAGETAEADKFAQLKATNLPAEILTTQSQRSLIMAELRVFANQAQSFATTHGHPANSPWRETQLGEIDPPDLNQLIGALENLNATAGELVELISRHRESGVASEADLLRAIAADDSLPPEAPNLGGLEVFAPVAIEAALALATEALQVESELAGLPQLGGVSAEGEASLRRLAQLNLPEELLSESPGSLVARIPVRVRRLNGHASVLAKIFPRLSALGFDSSVPFGVVRTLRAAVGFMSEPSLEWLKWYVVCGMRHRRRCVFQSTCALGRTSARREEMACALSRIGGAPMA